MKKIFLIFLLTIYAAFALFAEDIKLPRLAVVEFSINDSSNLKLVNDAVAVRNQVQSNIVKTGRYEVIARAEIDELLKNQKIMVSSISSSENIKKLKLLNIDYLITGSVDAMDSYYQVSISILDISNGRFTHSDEEFMNNSAPEVNKGVKNLVMRFVNGMASNGAQLISESKQSLQNSGDIGIQVKSAMAATVYLNNTEITSLWDNESCIIPIQKPGIYNVKLRFANGKESTQQVAVTSKEIVDVMFGMGIKDFSATVSYSSSGNARDAIILKWDSSLCDKDVAINVFMSESSEMSNAWGIEYSLEGQSLTVGYAWETKGFSWNKDLYFQIETEYPYGITKSEIVTAKVESMIGSKGEGGGYIFFDKHEKTNGWQYMEATLPLAEAYYGGYGVDSKEFYDFISNHLDEVKMFYPSKVSKNFGVELTDLLIKIIGPENESAAKLCRDYRGGNKDDWYFPGMTELYDLLDTLPYIGVKYPTGNYIYIEPDSADLNYYCKKTYYKGHSGIEHFYDMYNYLRKDEKAYVVAVRRY